MPIQQMMLGATPAGEKVYVEDVFSTFLYEGNSSARSINNGIDLSSEGGLIWTKARTDNDYDEHALADTERGVYKELWANTDAAETSHVQRVTSFNTDGYSLGTSGRYNYSSNEYVSWTFRKSPGFFDCMLYTGNNETAFNLSHDLGVVPALIILKSRTYANKWYVWLKGQSTNNQLWLASNTDQQTDSSYRVGQNATATHIQIPIGSEVNYTMNHVAYVFADGDQSDAQIFGRTGNQQITKSGSYSGNGSSNGTVVNLGWEPQWLLVKEIDGTGDWQIVDSMRGVVTGGDDGQLIANQADPEDDSNNFLEFTSTGFKLASSNSYWNENGKTYCYFAIRRADGYVGRPVSTGTDVFGLTYGTNSTNPSFVTNFPVDFSFTRRPTSTEAWYTAARLIQKEYLLLNSSDPEVGNANQTFDYQNGWHSQSSNLTSYFSWSWKRHAGFDVVCYTGDGSTRTINHSMNQSPEMMWFKRRDNTGNWYAYHVGMNGGSSPEDYALQINGNQNQDDNVNYFNDTAPTSSVFTLGGGNVLNGSSDIMIAFLFSSVSGVSKCGYYTGTGTSSVITVTTGFQPRLLILKGTGNSDYWWLLDTSRGWGSGNDQYIPISATDAQNGHNFGAPTSTGFTIPAVDNSSYNGSGQNYIYYAHA